MLSWCPVVFVRATTWWCPDQNCISITVSSAGLTLLAKAPCCGSRVGLGTDSDYVYQSSRCHHRVYCPPVVYLLPSNWTHRHMSLDEQMPLKIFYLVLTVEWLRPFYLALVVNVGSSCEKMPVSRLTKANCGLALRARVWLHDAPHQIAPTFVYARYVCTMSGRTYRVHNNIVFALLSVNTPTTRSISIFTI